MRNRRRDDAIGRRELERAGGSGWPRFCRLISILGLSELEHARSQVILGARVAEDAEVEFGFCAASIEIMVARVCASSGRNE